MVSVGGSVLVVGVLAWLWFCWLCVVAGEGGLTE